MNQRICQDREQAAMAREKYGNLADHPAFSYTKANTPKVMTSDRAIARKYRELEGIHLVRRIQALDEQLSSSCCSYATSYRLMMMLRMRMRMNIRIIPPFRIFLSISTTPQR